MNKINDDKGYGSCDEVDGPGDCDECKGCAVTANERQKGAFMLADEDTKTQTVRIRVTDLATLQGLKDSDDETPGGVMHRVLEDYGTLLQERSEPGEDEATLKKYDSIIAKQKEKIATLRREVEEQQNTATVLNSALADANENRGEGVREYAEQIATLQREKEEALDIMRQMTADHQADLIERGRMMQDLEDEIDEMTDESENIRLGSGGAININIFKGSRTGAE